MREGVNEPMAGTGRFYCVGCNRLEELAEAEVLFKTGYFKVVHPLGCCTSAIEASKSAEAPFAAGLTETGADVMPVFDAMEMPEAGRELHAAQSCTPLQWSLI